MAEGQNPEQIEFLSQLEIQLAVSGVPDVAAAFREIIKYEKEALKNISELKKRFGGFDGAIRGLVNSHKERGKASKKASKDELSSQSKLLKGYKKLTSAVSGYIGEVQRAALALVVPPSLGSAITAALNYNKSLIETSASVNRLGIGFGYLEKSLLRVSKETTLTRMETFKLFEQYQGGMRFISLEQFEKLLKRIKGVVGADVQAIGKMQQAISSLSKEYPSLVAGLTEMSDIDKEIGRTKIRNLYLIGKIDDAQYKQISAYISANRQSSDADKKALEIKQKQIEATNEFRRQWEAAKLTLGEGLLPIVEKLAKWLKQVQEYTKDWEFSLTKVVALYAGLKVTGMVLPAVGGAVAGRVLRGAGAAGAGAAGAGVAGAGAAAGGITLAGVAIAGAIATAIAAGAYGIATLVSDNFAEKQASWGWVQSLSGGKGGDFTKTEARLAAQKKAMASGSYVTQREKNARARSAKTIETGLKEGQKEDMKIVRDKGIGAAFGFLEKGKGEAQKKIESAEKSVELAKDNLSAGQKNSKELTIANDRLQEAKDALGVIQARQENITGLMALQGTKAEKLQGFYQAQVGEVDALIERMSITGNIDPVKIFESMEAPLQTLKETIEARKTLVKFLKIGDKSAIDEAAHNKKSSKATRETFKIYAEMTGAELASLDIVTVIAKENAKITEGLKEQNALLGKAGNAYSKLLNLTQEQATGAGLLVQLMDNYATGVGASMKVRKMEYEQLEEIKKVLQLKLRAQQEAYMRSVREEGMNQRSLGLQKDMQVTQNEITRASLQQASSVKSMKDGWISAIAAMNTGAGTFTEIIMDANTNTAQIMMLNGAVRSASSGALAMRDSFGRVIEDVGFMGSSRMTQEFNFSRRGGGQLSDTAYETGRPYGHNTALALERLLKGETSLTLGRLSGGAARIGRGDPTALAATGHPHVLSAFAERGGLVGGSGYQSPMSNSRGSNIIHLNLDNLHIRIDRINGLDELADKIGKEIGEEVAEHIGKYSTN